MQGWKESSRTGADRDFGLVPMIGPDRVADGGKSIAAQPVGEAALDPSEQPRPVEYQRRVELHERGAGADLRVGVVGARLRRPPRPAAACHGSVDTYRASTSVEGANRGGPLSPPASRACGTAQPWRARHGGVRDYDAVDAGSERHRGDVGALLFVQVRGDFNQQRQLALRRLARRDQLAQ